MYKKIYIHVRNKNLALQKKKQQANFNTCTRMEFFFRKKHFSPKLGIHDSTEGERDFFGSILCEMIFYLTTTTAQLAFGLP